MYTLKTETESRRVYINDQTGTEVATYHLRTGEDGEKWWAFEDLMNIPFMRKAATDHIAQLYSAGVTRDDLKRFIAALKQMLKSADAEKYEKSYAEVLRVERIMETATDPVKQSLALCTVYIMRSDERVDNYDFSLASQKIQAWGMQPDLQSFFLNWLTDGMNAYTSLYATASRIASTTLTAPQTEQP